MAAEASFKIEILSMSFGSKRANSSRGTPSITNKGLPSPRISNILVNCPGSEVFCTTRNPGSLPVNIFCMLVPLVVISCVLSIATTEPVNEAFFCVPYPTTTTSSNCSTSSLKTISSPLFDWITFTFWVIKPR